MFNKTIWVLTLFSFAGQTSCVKERQQDKMKPDTESKLAESRNTAIIAFDPSTMNMFEKHLRPVELTGWELRVIDSLLLSCVNAYNERIFETARIDFAKWRYRKQLIAVKNDSGEKEVWINCFCDEEARWELEPIIVDDGGKCFFNFKVNLKSLKCYNFRVNSSA